MLKPFFFVTKNKLLALCFNLDFTKRTLSNWPSVQKQQAAKDLQLFSLQIAELNEEVPFLVSQDDFN